MDNDKLQKTTKAFYDILMDFHQENADVYPRENNWHKDFINNLLDHIVVINRIGFMTRLKVKDFPVFTLKSYTAPKYIAPLEPANKNSLQRFGDAKWFSVHFLHVPVQNVQECRRRLGVMA